MGGGGGNRAGHPAARVCDSSGGRREYFSGRAADKRAPATLSGSHRGLGEPQAVPPRLAAELPLPYISFAPCRLPWNPARKPGLHSIAYSRAQEQPLSSSVPSENRQLSECDLGRATVATGTAAPGDAQRHRPGCCNTCRVCRLVQHASSDRSSDQCYMSTELLRFACGKFHEQPGAATRLSVQGRLAQRCLQHSDDFVACMRSLLALPATSLRARVDDFIHVACGAHLQCVVSGMVVGRASRVAGSCTNPRPSVSGLPARTPVSPGQRHHGMAALLASSTQGFHPAPPTCRAALSGWLVAPLPGTLVSAAGSPKRACSGQGAEPASIMVQFAALIASAAACSRWFGTITDPTDQHSNLVDGSNLW